MIVSQAIQKFPTWTTERSSQRNLWLFQIVLKTTYLQEAQKKGIPWALFGKPESKCQQNIFYEKKSYVFVGVFKIEVSILKKNKKKQADPT